MTERPMTPEAIALASPKWRGEPGGVETWYATFTDRRTGDGYRLHAETLATRDGDATGHGWFAAFPHDGDPAVERFGPEAVLEPAGGDAWFDAAGCTLGPGYAIGKTPTLSWDLSYHSAEPPLCTVPRWVFERGLLPAQQVVPVATGTFRGTLALGDATVRLEEAYGGLAHVYGRGHPRRWGWLHADLGYDDVLEVVSAVPTGAGLARLPAVSFVQLRRRGRDWPADPLLTAPLLRGRLGLPHWGVSGIVGRHRLRVDVVVPVADLSEVDEQPVAGRASLLLGEPSAVLQSKGRAGLVPRGAVEAEPGFLRVLTEVS
jgi:hypothetical protein